MRRICLLLAIAAAALASKPLSQGERDFAMSNLHASRKMFLDRVAGLSEAQWRFKPAPDRWSIAECAEHIALAEDFLFHLVTEKVMKSPPSPGKTPPSREEDETVIKRVGDRSQKFNAPDPLKPSGRWPDKDTLIPHFKASRGRTISYVETSTDDMRSHVLQDRDAYQWLLFISGHTERHVAQIDEVKADSNFPRD